MKRVKKRPGGGGLDAAFLSESREDADLERKLCFALGLSPDDQSEEETHTEDDAEGDDVPHDRAPLDSQHTERQDQHSCRAAGEDINSSSKMEGDLDSVCVISVSDQMFTYP